MSNKIILIGIDNYLHHDKLFTCEKDLIDFKNTLLSKFDFNEFDILELYNSKATNKNIQDLLTESVKTLTAEDNLILFFSGHGHYREVDERGFWIPYDATSEYTTWLANETIIRFIEKMKCKHLFLISDSCFAYSLLNQEQSKSNPEYDKRPSRWALTSAFDEAYSPKDSDSNSLFVESIIEYLENVSIDFRISKLIEHVKDEFTGNVMQTPQGSVLKVSGHKGGEMVLKIIEPIDVRGLKGYNNFLKVLKLYKRNAKFTELSKHEEKKSKVGFQLYQEFDSVIKRATYYLYLYIGINQTQTLGYLKINHPTIFRDKNLIVFLPKEKEQLDLDRRINNIKKKFKPINIFYIDDFIRDECTPSLFDEDEKNQLLQLSNFIVPSFTNSKFRYESNVTLFIKNWLSKEGDPILVIKGSGGIGKTTFAQHIADEAVKKSPKTFTFFIDSVLIKDNLIKRNKFRNQINLYSFYEALFNQEDSTDSKLTEELFNLNIDAGNIVVVIDGLDEVISKIPNFNVDLFLRSIVDSSNELGGGKVIITCRTHFWNKTHYSNHEFKIIELMPFDKNQTLDFFEKSFDSRRKRKKALNLAEEFKFTNSNEEGVYHPYVLDIIRSIISSEKDSMEMDLTRFSSKILNNDIKIDYIIYRVCDRERKRVGQISVDEQVKFFIHLANAKRGNITTHNFKNEIEEALSRHVNKVNIEAFKSHPFLQNIGTKTWFKYDFFAEIFKSIYMASFFNYSDIDREITDSFLDTIDENCLFESSLNSEIVNRIKSWTDDDILLVSDIIDQVSNKGGLKLKKKKSVVANIFNISLSINHKIKTNDTNSNTKLLRAIFEKSKFEIKNLSIMNLVSNRKIRFDFSNLMIEKAVIDNYNSFYECTFDENTKFINCQLINNESSSDHPRIPSSIFIDCSYDRNIENAMNSFEEKEKSSIDDAKSFLNSFLHLFYSNGRLGRQWEDKVIKVRFKGIDKYNYGYKKVIKIMKRRNIIEATNEKEGVKFSINDKYKEDIIRYVKDGTVSKTITDLIKDFSNE